MQKRRPQGDSLRAALVFMGSGVQAASDRTAGVVAAADGQSDVEGIGAVADGVHFLAVDAVYQTGVGQHVGTVDDGIALDVHLYTAVQREGGHIAADRLDGGLRIGLHAQSVQGGGHHAHGVLGLLHVELGGRVRGDDGHVLLVHGQPQGGVKGLSVGAVNDHVVAHLGEHEVVHLHHGGAAVTVHGQGVAQAAGGQDDGIRCFGVDELLGDLGAGLDFHTVQLQLTDQVVLQVGQILMGALDVGGEFELSA